MTRREKFALVLCVMFFTLCLLDADGHPQVAAFEFLFALTSGSWFIAERPR